MNKPQLTIDDKYKAHFLLNKSSNCASYRVKDVNSKNYFLKLFELGKLSEFDFTAEGKVLEIEILKNIDHPNITKYYDCGETVVDSKKMAYLVTEYISGETLSDHIHRTLKIDAYDAIQYAIQILKGLEYLHELTRPITHNAINTDNIILDVSGNITTAKIIGFGHARYLNQPRDSFYYDDLNPFFVANECFNKVYSAQSDIFSVGALIYNAIYGMPPWYINLPQSDGQVDLSYIKKARIQPLKLVSSLSDQDSVSSSLLNIIDKSLSRDLSIRYKNAADFIQDLTQELENVSAIPELSNTHKLETKPVMFSTIKDSKGGFSAIAGMAELKDILTNDVISVFHDAEGAEKYGLTIPNGMLLYGPPGCGKTYIAERLAEEIEFNYYFVQTSDLASIYIHGSQEKIGSLFKDAFAKKPSIICFDEFDSFSPRRDGINNTSMSGEVNEFLSQLNNCGKAGVFVIATTNRPDLIDPALLRKGRMDLIIYVSPPDFDARVGLFELYLQGKPVDFGIDCDELANKTDKYVASDIEFIVTEAARRAYKTKTRISQELILQVLSNTNPSVSEDDLEFYLNQKLLFEKSKSKKNIKKTLGFRQSEDKSYE
jgi:transitional endoplasmic reticulum ATPase